MNKELEEAIKMFIDLDVGDDIEFIKNRNIILNYIDNSILREAIKEKIEEHKQQLKNSTKRVAQLQVLEQNGGLQQSEWEELNTLFGDIEKIRGKIEALEELLEKN